MTKLFKILINKKLPQSRERIKSVQVIQDKKKYKRKAKYRNNYMEEI